MDRIAAPDRLPGLNRIAQIQTRDTGPLDGVDRPHVVAGGR